MPVAVLLVGWCHSNVTVVAAAVVGPTEAPTAPVGLLMVMLAVEPNNVAPATETTVAYRAIAA